MELTIHDDKVPLRIDDGGAVRVGPTRVTLAIFLNCFKQGMGAEEIAINYPTIPLGDIYAVIGYYLHHREELDRWLDDFEARAAQLEEEIEASQPGMVELRERILARWAAMKSQHASTTRR
jgi:uncharacterized protein (DUF433 family)